MKKCCCTGHRPSGFNWNYTDKKNPRHKEYLQALKNTLERLITVENYDYFISGGAIGVDTDFAETVLFLKKKYNVNLELAIPCKNHDLKWLEKDKKRFKKILKRADVVNVLSNEYTPTCMFQRNAYMVDCADKVLAVWNGEEKGGTWQTIKYARKKDKPLEFIRI